MIWLGYLCLVTDDGLRVVQDGEVWLLSGPAAARFGLVNEFLGYLADRNYSPRTRRSYAFDLMAFARWLDGEGVELAGVDVDVLLRFLTACREAMLPGRAGGNVYSIRDGRNTGYAPATINRRLAAISALFAFREMRDPVGAQPGAARAGRPAASHAGSAAVCWRMWPSPRTGRRLRLREPRRLPRGLTREESAALLGSFRTWRDRAIAGLMLLSGLRSAEVLGLLVADVDIGGRWVRVIGKGDKERRVPLDVDVAGAIQTYLLAERPETDSHGAVRGGQGPAPGAAADARPGCARSSATTASGPAVAGRASARAAAHVRHRAGRGRGRPGGDAGAAGPRPRRLPRPATSTWPRSL